MVHHHNPSFRRKRQIINGQGHAALNTATPIRQRNGACSTELRQGQVNCIVPDYHPTILEVQVCALGFSEKDKNIRRRRLLTSLVSLVAGHAGVAFPTLADLASWLSPHVTEIFGDYPHEWGLRKHFGDGTIRPPVTRTFPPLRGRLQAEGLRAHPASSLSCSSHQ